MNKEPLAKVGDEFAEKSVYKLRKMEKPKTP